MHNLFSKQAFSKQEVVYQLRKLKVKALGTDGITRDAVWAINAKVWMNWLNRLASTGFVPKALRELRLTLLQSYQRRLDNMEIVLQCPKCEGGEAQNGP